MLTAECTEADKQKLAPRIGVFVEEEADSGTFVPIGCCITEFTPPGLSRAANIEPTCLTLEVCCDPAIEDAENAASCENAPCDTPPDTTPGDMEESTFEFTTNHAPCSPRTTWFETAVQCPKKLPFHALPPERLQANH